MLHFVRKYKTAKDLKILHKIYFQLISRVMPDFRLSPRTRWKLRSSESLLGESRNLESWPLKMGPIGCSETSARNYYSLRNSPEERSSQCHWYLYNTFFLYGPFEENDYEIGSTRICTKHSWYLFSVGRQRVYLMFMDPCIII